MSIHSHVIFIGTSGAGKSTLARHLISELPSLKLWKTYTTRPKRSPDDNSHIFITELEFAKLAQADQFIGTLSIFGYNYGIKPLPVDTNCLVLLRLPVITKFKAVYPNCQVISIEAPLPLLQKRLTARGTIDRFDENSITREMCASRKIADYQIDSSLPIDICIRQIRRFLDA